MKYGGKVFSECTKIFNDLNIDSNRYSILLFAVKTNVSPKITRKNFKHKNQDFLMYYNELEPTHGNEGVNIHRNLIKIPKTKDMKIIINNKYLDC